MGVEVVQLEDICDFAYGDGLIEAERQGGLFPVYGSNGIVGWHDKALTTGPTIVIGRKGSIGEIHLSHGPCWPIDTTYYIQSAKRPTVLTWLYYLLLALDLTQLNKSAAVPGLSRNDAYEKRVPFPSLPEQQRIAAILERADRLRRLRRYALELSAGYLHAVFVEIFGDPVRNPKGWRVIRLSQAFSQKPQIGMTRSADDRGEQVVVRVGEIGNGDVALERCKRTTLHGVELRRFLLVPGDILIARAIGSLEHLGKASILQPTDQAVVFDSHVMRLRFKPAAVHPRFFLEWLQSSGGRQRFLQKAGRTAVQYNVNSEQISDVAIALPPVPAQDEFVHVAHRMDRLRAQQREALRQAEQLFGALLDRAFRGEL